MRNAPSLSPRDVTVQPVSDVLLPDALKIPDTRDLQNDDTVVVVDSSQIEKAIYNAPGTQHCFNDPERKERPTPIGR